MALTDPMLKTEINAEIESIGEEFNSLLRASSTRKHNTKNFQLRIFS